MFFKIFNENLILILYMFKYTFVHEFEYLKQVLQGFPQTSST